MRSKTRFGSWRVPSHILLPWHLQPFLGQALNHRGWTLQAFRSASGSGTMTSHHTVLFINFSFPLGARTLGILSNSGIRPCFAVPHMRWHGLEDLQKNFCFYGFATVQWLPGKQRMPRSTGNRFRKKTVEEKYCTGYIILSLETVHLQMSFIEFIGI